MTLVLAIDSSGSTTGIGLGRAGAPGIAVTERGSRRHAEVIDELMMEVRGRSGDEHVDAIAVGVGPGPYSGLRVGIAFAIGLGRAWRCPVVGVCSLDAVAWTVADTDPLGGGFVVATDARRGEAYWALYDSQGLRVMGPQVTTRDRIPPEVDIVSEHEVDCAFMASRVAAFLDQGITPVSVEGGWAPHGADGSQVSVPLGPLLAPHPLYLRAPDITLTTKQSIGPAI